MARTKNPAREKKKRKSKTQRSLERHGLHVAASTANNTAQRESDSDNNDDDDDEYVGGGRIFDINDEEKDDEEEEPLLRLTGKPLRESYAQYHEILKEDRHIERWRPREDDSGPLHVFMEAAGSDEEEFHDEQQLTRMQNRIAATVQQARETLSEECLTHIFGDQHDTSTPNGRLFYTALQRFNALQGAKEQEGVLFTIVAGSLLRRVTLGEEALHNEQVKTPYERGDNVWNVKH